MIIIFTYRILIKNILITINTYSYTVHTRKAYKVNVDTKMLT